MVALMQEGWDTAWSTVASGRGIRWQEDEVLGREIVR
jgi:hypothetical protein